MFVPHAWDEDHIENFRPARPWLIFLSETSILPKILDQFQTLSARRRISSSYFPWWNPRRPARLRYRLGCLSPDASDRLYFDSPAHTQYMIYWQQAMVLNLYRLVGIWFRILASSLPYYRIVWFNNPTNCRIQIPLSYRIGRILQVAS